MVFNMWPTIELITHQDDEYVWAGVEDPKVVITTSHNPSSRLKQFAKVSVLLLMSESEGYLLGYTGVTFDVSQLSKDEPW